jgi:hypothetical protein
MVSTDDITQINNKNLMGQHPGFASVFGSQIGGSVGPDTLCGDPRHGPPEQPLHEWRSASGSRLLDFSSTAPQPSFVAITGGTADYRTATREVKFIDDIHWELTVITPP